MSFVPTSWRPFAQSPWGGRATWRGAMSAPSQSDMGMLMVDPQVIGIEEFGQIGSRFYRSMAPTLKSVLSGVSRDGTGAVLGACKVHIFKRLNDAWLQVAETTSDATSGAWSVPMLEQGPFWIAEYKAGSPDRAGASVNTITPTVI